MSDRPEGNNGNGRKPLRIIVFTTDFLPGPGGVQKHIFLFAAGLTKEGHHTTVVTESPAFGFDDAELPFPVLRRVGLIRLFRLIASADIIHLAGPPFIPLLIAFLLGKPIVIEHHGYHAICPNGLLLYEPDRNACSGHFMRREYGKCLRCMTTSRSSLRSLWQLLLTFPRRWLCQWGASSNVTVSAHVQQRLQLPRSLPIYHGVPDPMAGGQPSPSIPTVPLCLAYVGRLVAEKGLPVLVEAASRARNPGHDFHLKFVGDGPERGHLERMVSERGLSSSVTFTGFLSGAQFDRATEDVAVVVMPSIMEETAGLAAIEQMMRGRLVIVSDIGGLGEIVDGAGLKFAAGDVEQLAACIRRVLEEPELVSEIGQRARRRSLELFTEDRKIRTYLTLYYGLLTQRRDVSASPRILIYSADFWPLIGGVQSIVMGLARGLSDGRQCPDGMTVTVVTETPIGSASDEHLPFRVVRKPGWVELFRSLSRSDVIHLAGPALLPLIFGFLCRKRIIIEHHGFQSICPNGLLLYEPTGSACPGYFMQRDYGKCLRCLNTTRGAFRGLWQLTLTFPRRWLCQQGTGFNVMASEHVKQRIRLPRSLPIYHGVPDTLADGEPLAPVSAAPLCFAYVGRLVTEKGLPVLVEAASRLQKLGYDFRLKIIGDGPELERLEQMVQERKLSSKVDFMGFLTGKQFERATKDVAVVVMPSIMEETAGLAAIEQMMRGRLVIASDIGGLGEIVGGAGLKFPAGDVEQFVACMRRALDEPDLVAKIGQRARQRSLDIFREDRMIEAHLQLYQNVIYEADLESRERSEL